MPPFYFLPAMSGPRRPYSHGFFSINAAAITSHLILSVFAPPPPYELDQVVNPDNPEELMSRSQEALAPYLPETSNMYVPICKEAGPFVLPENQRAPHSPFSFVLPGRRGEFLLGTCHKAFYLDEGLVAAYAELMFNQTVVELGAGCGCYTYALQKSVRKIRGFDGVPNIGKITHNLVKAVDLSEDIAPAIEPHDWSICTEVGEHIPIKFENILFRNIVAHVKKGIVLSWALPGQQGVGHVNGHSNMYVIRKMAKFGFVLDGPQTLKLRKAATLSWFKNTMMVFMKKDFMKALPEPSELTSNIEEPDYDADVVFGSLPRPPRPSRNPPSIQAKFMSLSQRQRKPVLTEKSSLFIPTCKEAGPSVATENQFPSRSDARHLAPGRHGQFLLDSCDRSFYLDHGLAEAYAELLRGQTVVELGAGCGCYTHVLQSFARKVVALDGAQYIGRLTDKLVSFTDLSQDISHIIEPHDWSVCVEIGEHIPKEFEDHLLRNVIANVKKGVVLSWAVPGDDEGVGHINEHTNAYVIRKMAQLGFSLDKQQTLKLRSFTTLRWIKNAIMVFKKNSFMKHEAVPAEIWRAADIAPSEKMIGIHRGTGRLVRREARRSAIAPHNQRALVSLPQETTPVALTDKSDTYIPSCRETGPFVLMEEQGPPSSPVYSGRHGQFLLETCEGTFFLDHGLAELYAELMFNQTVVELGAGCGCYTHALQKSVQEIVAYDGVPHIGRLTDNLVKTMDLSQDISSMIEPHDWTICTEVGEHIPRRFEDHLFRNIIANVKKGVVLSWAIPGQEGVGHINERTNKYVIHKMDKLGFQYERQESQKLRSAAALSWFKNTLMVFKKRRRRRSAKREMKHDALRQLMDPILAGSEGI